VLSVQGQSTPKISAPPRSTRKAAQAAPAALPKAGKDKPKAKDKDKDEGKGSGKDKGGHGKD
jgi:hypothetical protein